MIDTDKYEGHTEGLWYAEEEEVEEGKAWTVRGGDHWVVTESDGCLRIDWKKEDALLAADAPLLLEEVKRLREVIGKEHPTFDWASRQTIANLEAEVKRWHKVRDYILEKSSYPTVKKLHLKDLLNFMEEVIE